MAILPIITVPDSRLKVISETVGKVDDAIRALSDNMLETMYQAPGIGLAAVQVGVPKRLIVLDVTPEEGEPAPLVLVNPEIQWRSEELWTYEEGCLSLPEQYADVSRPRAIRLIYRDRDGEKQKLETEKLLAVCIQHEMDHLEGILFVDHLSLLKRRMILRKLVKARRQDADDGS